tara:strand:- start:306 stop:1802 length:1497 start_codon:yes stop_codon:yes gene_type:complete
MLCGLSDKGRCKRVYSKDDLSDECETSGNKNQKRCKRKSIKNPKINPKINPKKICPKGKVLNPKTNRCILDRKKQKTKKKICPPGKIINPKTNRCIINRRLPKDKVIDFKYRCKPGYIYNHQSQRCVKKDGPTGKKIEITSITNKIGGPISMHYYKFKVNNVMKHFLLFGDRHTQYVHHTSPETIEVTTLVKKIIRKSNKCIDIFSENPPYHELPKGKKIQKYSSPLNAMRHEFYGCPVHHMRGVKCDYDNLRYQNWDLRFKAEIGKKWVSNPYDELFMKYPREYGLINDRFSKTNIILYLLGFTEKIKGNVYQTSKRIEQQIDKYFDETLDNLLKRKTFADEVSDKDFFQSTRKLIRKEYNKCIRSVKFPKDLLDTFIKTYQQIRDTDYTLVFTDFYTICRMFMKFDNNKHTPKKCKEKGKKNTPQYIIYYAGDSHTQNICKFLENMFGENPIYTTKWLRPHGKSDKLIHLNNITNHLGYPLEDIKNVDDLFKDFYE